MYAVVEQKRWRADKEYFSLHYSEEIAQKLCDRYNKKHCKENNTVYLKYDVIDANKYNINRKMKQLFLD